MVKTVSSPREMEHLSTEAYKIELCISGGLHPPK